MKKFITGLAVLGVIGFSGIANADYADFTPGSYHYVYDAPLTLAQSAAAALDFARVADGTMTQADFEAKWPGSFQPGSDPSLGGIPGGSYSLGANSMIINPSDFKGQIALSDGTIIGDPASTSKGYVDYNDSVLQDQITIAQTDIVNLQGDMSTAQGDISTLQGDMSTAQGDISTLQGEMLTAQGDITTLQGEMLTAQGDITTLQGEMLTAQGDITTLQDDVIAAHAKADALDANKANLHTTGTAFNLTMLDSTGQYVDSNISVADVGMFLSATYIEDYQFYAEQDRVNNEISRLDGRIDALGTWAKDMQKKMSSGIASATALTGIDNHLDPTSRYSIGVAGGHYNGQSSVAMGAVVRTSFNSALNFGVAIDTYQAKPAMRMGWNIQW